MTPTETLDDILNGKAIRGAVEGLGEAYFQAIMLAYGSDQPALNRLKKVAPKVRRHATDKWQVERGEAVFAVATGAWADAADRFEKASGLARGLDKGIALLPAVDCWSRTGNFERSNQAFVKCKRLLRNDKGLLARARVNQANALEQRDALAESYRESKKALVDLAEERPLDKARALSVIASSASEMGQLQESVEAARQAIDIFNNQGQTALVAAVVPSLALGLIATGQPDEALQELQAYQDRVPAAHLASYLQVLGDCLSVLNLWTEARQAYDQALVAKPTAVTRGNCLLGLAQTHIAERQFDESRPLLTKAKAIFVRFGNRAMVGWVTGLQAEIAVAQGRTKTGQALAAKAAQLLAKEGWTTLAKRFECLALQPRSSESKRRLLSLSKDAATQVRWRALARLASSTRGKKRTLYQERVLRTLLTSRLSLRSTISRASFFADKADSVFSIMDEWLGSSDPRLWDLALRCVVSTRSATLVDEIQRSLKPDLQRKLVEIRSELATDDESSIPSGLRLSRTVKARRAPGQSWLFESPSRETSEPMDMPIFVDAGRSAFWISPGSEPVSLSKERVKEAIIRLRCELFSPLFGSSDVEACFGELAQLQNSLRWGERMGPICPDGMGWGVPWQLMNATSSAGNEVSLCLIPRPAPAAPLKQDSARRAMLWVAESDSLPHITKEAEAFKRRFPDAIVCRTKKEVFDCIDKGPIGILHVAAHGQHAAENPMFSGIEFSDGVLTAAEVASLPINIEYAVLLSCESGRLTGTLMREPDGFVRAFIALGSKAAIGCSWHIDDATAYDFQEKFYDSWKSHGIVEALSEARNHVRNSRPHPFYWGGPALFLGYLQNELNSPFQQVQVK